MRKILIAAALCMSITTASVSAARFGVNTHMGDYRQNVVSATVKSAEKVKASWIRDGSDWRWMQTSPTAELKIGSKSLDYIKKTDKAGINQLFVLGAGNPNYDGVETDTVIPKASDEDYYQGWLDYVTYTVGQVKDYVEAYEVWNEPNIKGFNYNLEASGEDYAKLYLDTRKIVNKLDPTARLCCGSITGAGESDFAYAKEIMDYIKSQGDVNELIDVFSIHLYTNLSTEGYASALKQWEEFFDSYGFAGDVWMTENGVSSDDVDSRTETAQAEMVAKLGTLWENYLMENNRNGISFWYDLRNDVGISDHEDNFGLVDCFHSIKPAGYAMEIYNRLTGDKSLSEYQTPKTAEESKWFGLSKTEYYGKLAKYRKDSSTVYVAYDENGRNDTKMDIPLSGDVAFVYNCLGEITETITNPSGTKSLSVNSSPQYVECVNSAASINNLRYDSERNILTVSGEYAFGTTTTLEVVNQEGETVQTKTVITDGSRNFETWFSLEAEGELTLYLARSEQPEKYAEKAFTAVKTIPESEKPRSVADGTAVAYDKDSGGVSVSGGITNFADTDFATVLVVSKTPATAEKLTNLPPSEIAYIGQTSLLDGKFSFSFKMPADSVGEYAVYIGGTRVVSAQENAANVGNVPEYVYVSSFEAAKADGRVNTAARLKNLNSEPKKAVVVIAQYGEDKKLVRTDYKELTVPAYTTAATEYPYSADIDKEAASVYTFIWEDFDSIRPLAPKIEVK